MAGAAPSYMISAPGGGCQKADATKGYDDRQDDGKPLAATIVVLAFLFVALGMTAALLGLLLAHGAYAAWMLFETIAG
jgi:hypothetical protein